MFELFIALFGGAYYGGKILGERAEQSAVRKENASTRSREEKWRDGIIDRELESELRLFISRPENLNAVLEEVSCVYDDIFQGKRVDELYPRWLWCENRRGLDDKSYEEEQIAICKLNSNNALRIMMAKRGKFPSLDAISGSSKRFSPQTKLEAQILIWCAEELKRHGVQEEFYVPEVLIGFGEGGEYMGWIV